ncbi:IPT/TIG domain-containing protein [Aquiluna sp.]|nr:IPT/TIG domain-containing protein [Aquiluna sp.]
MKLFLKFLANTITALLAAGFLVAAPTSISTSASAETIISQLGLDIDGAAGDRIGSSVSLSSDGTRVAIGAIRGDVGDIAAGTVRIYDWNGSSWTQVGSDIDGETNNDSSGKSVSLSSDGSRVAIGASGNDGNGDMAGHVRIFDYNGTAWAQVGPDIDGETAGDQSGYSVSLSSDGSRVAIGAWLNDGNGDMAGHVRIFDYNGTAWAQVGSDIDGETAGDKSGYSVSLSSDGSRVAIGAYENDGNGGNRVGHVRIYDWNGSSWTQVGSDIDGEADVDLSGYAVSLSSDGSRVAIGASYNDAGGETSGHVRIYDWNGTTWTTVGSDIDGEAAGDLLGYQVSLSSDGNRVAIGARQDSAVDNMRGSARVYDWNGNAWVKLGSNINGEAETDFFGDAVSLSSDGTAVAVGTPYNDGNGAYAGHTRMFSLAAPAPAPAPAPYSGPLPTAASPGAGSAGEQITITGIRLSTITSVQIDGVAAAIVSVEKTSLVFTLPEGLEAGTKSIVLNSSYGKLTYQDSLEYKAAAPVAVVEPEADSAIVNAGSFDGYVAVYAKGHEGKTLSWKIAGKWFKTEITSNYQVFQRKTAAIGKDVKVDLYIDGKSQLSKLVRTR